jgi:putative membrane-bound dehydrogenase-like protein
MKPLIHLCAILAALGSANHMFAADPATRGKPVFQSKVVTGAPVDIKANLKGAKELYLVVTDGGDGYTADWADWIEPTLIKADGSTIKLTELKPKAVQVGFGQLGVNSRSDGKTPMRVNGKDVAFGFATHAPAVVGFDLPPDVVSFESRGGIDEGGTSQGIGGCTVVFQIHTEPPPEHSARSNPAHAGPDSRYGRQNAMANMETFKTPDDLTASLVACEPMVINPTNIEVDHRGRVWAVECTNYRGHMDSRPEGDRVVILEDTDGDSIADKDKTFYQSKELTNPLGICVLPQGTGTRVIVSAAPNVWLLTDKDGDDVAEDARILFKVGGEWNYDHQIHAFVFGMDGKFYFNSGNSITQLTWPDGTIVRDLAGNEITNQGKPYRQGMVFRCDIDLDAGVARNVETLAHNFRNNYEVAVDSFGTMWQSDNDDDGNQGVRINYVMEWGNYGFTDELTGAGWQAPRTNIETEIPRRHWHLNDPGVVPNLLLTGAGSPTGILVNEGSALGPAFTNQLIHCDAGPRTTRAYPVAGDGAGYKAAMQDLLTSTDPWYRASDLAIAPDGSLVVADWYDPGVGGHAMGDNVKGRMMGRVYRVAPAGDRPVVVRPDVSTPAGAAAALASPNNPTRFLGWQALHAMGAAAEPALQSLWQSPNPRLRARALALLARITDRGQFFLTAGLKDPDPDLRIAAIRLSMTLPGPRTPTAAPLPIAPALLADLLHDRNPQVRRQLALSLRGAKDIAPLWTTLARQHDGKDRWYLEALGIGAAGNDDACLSAWLAAVGDQWNTPAGRDIIWRLRSKQSATWLAKILSDPTVAETEKPRFLRAFDFLPASDDRTKALVSLAALGDNMPTVAAEALARLQNVDLNANPELKAFIETQAGDAKGTPRFIALVRDFRLRGQAPALLETALNHPQHPLANEALGLVFAEAGADRLIRATIEGRQSAAMIALLGASVDRRATDILVSIVTSQDRAESRVPAVNALARSQTGAAALVALARQNQLPADLKPAATSALHLVQYSALQADIASLFPAPAALGGKPLPPISELVKTTGDINRGRIIAERPESSCVVCHRIGDKGVDFAPALTEIGSKLAKEAIYDAIINPNSGLSMGFETTLLETSDGVSAVGIVRSETAGEIVLALPGGTSNRFDKGRITKREKLATSLMPSGLNQALTQADLTDLVEYLSSLGRK